MQEEGKWYDPMSFTQDELQALNAIVEQKLSLQRRELERTFDQRMHTFRRDLEQRLVVVQQDLLRNFSRRLLDQQKKLRETFSHRLDTQQAITGRAITHEFEQRQQQQRQQFEDLIGRALAAQLIAIEQLINQHIPMQTGEQLAAYTNEQPAEFDAIEVQTEIPWEDLVELIAKVLDERLSMLNTSMQARMKETERTLSGHIHHLRDTFTDGHVSTRAETSINTFTNMQDVFNSIEQLERIVESMQVTMAANSALLSNRLYHHQQLPFERAHNNHHMPPPEKSAPAEHTAVPDEQDLEDV